MNGLSESKTSLKRIWRVLVSLQVWPNLKWEWRLENEGTAHKMTRPNESERLVREVEMP